MKSELTRIGNSRGVRIPKPIIEQCGLSDIVDLRVTPEGLLISPHRALRQGWREAFAAAAPANEEMLLEGAASNAFDEEEWTW